MPPETAHILPSILFVVLLLLLSALFSGSETAFFSLNKIRIEKLKKSTRAARKIENLKKHPNQLLSTILLGNMFTNITLSSFVTFITLKTLGTEFIPIVIIILTILVILFGEILPKTLAIYTADKFALIVSDIIGILNKLFYPFSKIVIYASNGLFKLIFKTSNVKKDILTEEELKTALESSRKEGIIDPEEEDMIHYVMEFSDTEAKEILTPRIEMKAIELNSSKTHIENFLKETKHALIPIYENTIDNIVGILKTKDFFLDKDKELKDLITAPYLIPENQRLDTLLSDFYNLKRKIAIVVDEYGGTSGMITLEDLQEEIFGEIYDEFETPQEQIVKLSDKKYKVSAKVLVSDLNYELDITLPEEEDTLAGFILSLIERFPKKGDSVKYKNIEFIIEKATAKRILYVIVLIHDHE